MKRKKVIQKRETPVKMQVLVPNGERIPQEVLDILDRELTLNRVEYTKFIYREGPDFGISLYEHWERDTGISPRPYVVEVSWYFHFFGPTIKVETRERFATEKEARDYIPEQPPVPSISCPLDDKRKNGENLISYWTSLALRSLETGVSPYELHRKREEEKRREMEEWERFRQENPDSYAEAVYDMVDYSL